MPYIDVPPSSITFPIQSWAPILNLYNNIESNIFADDKPVKNLLFDTTVKLQEPVILSGDYVTFLQARLQKIEIDLLGFYFCILALQYFLTVLHPKITLFNFPLVAGVQSFLSIVENPGTKI